MGGELSAPYPWNRRPLFLITPSSFSFLPATQQPTALSHQPCWSYQTAAHPLPELQQSTSIPDMSNFDEPFWVAPFLDELERHGMAARAARAAGITAHAVEKYAGAHPEFEQARQEALDLFADTLEEAAVTRAVEGVSKPVFYKGDQCGEVQEYSDGLLTTLLKGRRGHMYGDKKEVNFRGDVQIVMAGVAQPLAPGQSRSLQAERAAARTTSLPHPTQAELAHDRVEESQNLTAHSAEDFL